MSPICRLQEAMSAFSLAIDLAEKVQFEHSRTVGYISLRIGHKMDLSSTELETLYYAAILHDIGALEFANPEAAYFGNRNFLISHTEKGSKLVKEIPHGEQLADIILYHHENWNGTGLPRGIADGEIPLFSRIIRIADEMSHLRSPELFKQLCFIVKKGKGTLFDPDIADVALELCDEVEFALDIQGNGLKDAVERWAPQSLLILDLEQMVQVAEVFAKLIDMKDSHTAEHSKRVAETSLALAEEYQFSSEKKKKMYIAGLLHDIGKIAVPNSILMKSGRLTDDEFKVIKSHAYYTKIILSQIKGIEDISSWAWQHHEKLDGSGYPSKLKSRQLKIESRMIAVADIFDAITSERAYRKKMSEEEAFRILGNLSKNGQIDKEICSVFFSLFEKGTCKARS